LICCGLEPGIEHSLDKMQLNFSFVEHSSSCRVITTIHVATAWKAIFVNLALYLVDDALAGLWLTGLDTAAATLEPALPDHIDLLQLAFVQAQDACIPQ